jgi:hypothetical protein
MGNGGKTACSWVAAADGQLDDDRTQQARSTDSASPTGRRPGGPVTPPTHLDVAEGMAMVGEREPSIHDQPGEK